VHSGTEVTAIENSGARMLVRGSKSLSVEAEIVIVAPGVSPSNQLAADSGLELGHKGAIRVNRRMETSQPNVYGAGDCAETGTEFWSEIPTFLLVLHRTSKDVWLVRTR
jgi:NADPH-dependent 2,4-dienoyl-CoA reductase/sulfur reductase-like enzyme